MNTRTPGAALLALSAVALVSCASAPPPPPAPVPDDQNSYFQAMRAKQDLFQCAAEYAMSHVESKASASEVADAAVAACRTDIERFRTAMTQAAYTVRNARYLTPDDVRETVDKAAADISQQARGRALQVVINHR